MALLGWSPASSIILCAIILFFLLAILNKFLNDFGVAFNKWIAWPVGIILLIIIANVWALKPGFGIGFGGGLAAGIIGGFTVGDTSSDE